MTGQVATSGAESPIAAVSADIWDALVRGRSERRDWLRLERLVRRTDRLLDEVERLNLGEVDRLPPSLNAKLARLFSDLPFAFEPAMGGSATPTDVLDVLFGLQEQIFTLKTGVAPGELDDEVAERDAGGADRSRATGEKKGGKRRNGARDAATAGRRLATGRARPADAA